jgi:hypothetical protein
MALAKGGLEVPVKIFTLRLVFGFGRNKNLPLPVKSHKTCPDFNNEPHSRKMKFVNP